MWSSDLSIAKESKSLSFPDDFLAFPRWYLGNVPVNRLVYSP